MNKMFIALSIFMFLSSLCICPNVTHAQASYEDYVISANYANLYDDYSISANSITQLKNKTKVKVLIDNGTPQIFESENFSFYKAKYESHEGYVLADLVTPATKKITSIPNYNASTNSNCTVFFMEGETLKESTIQLEKQTRIFLYEGFDSKKDYIAIAFEHENEVLYGYIKKDYVNPDGINPIIITAISIIIAILGIIFTWLFMKNRKTKIKKNVIKT